LFGHGWMLVLRLKAGAERGGLGRGGPAF
jgi:hypothetical protein